MSRIKDRIYDLMEQGILDWENPRFDLLTSLKLNPDQVYGLYVNNELSHVYMHRDAADYECWLCSTSDKTTDEPFHYEVKPIPFTRATYQQLRRN